MIEGIDAWMAALEARQLADLTFAEVSRSLRALSSTYVERRAKLKEGAALSGAGKRAAFALFYGPLHCLLLHHIVSTLGTAVHDNRDGVGPGVRNRCWQRGLGDGVRPRASRDRHHSPPTGPSRKRVDPLPIWDFEPPFVWTI